MKTAELKIGDWVMQRNGWPAKLLEKSADQDDICVCCMVHGLFTESGSIYCHDIVTKIELVARGQNEITEGDMSGDRYDVVAPIFHTAKQMELRQWVQTEFGL